MIMAKKTKQKSYEERIAFLPREMRAFALRDENTRLNIMEQNLDEEEIDSIVVVNMHYENLKKKQKITMNVP